jgi:hypothetical protein
LYFTYRDIQLFPHQYIDEGKNNTRVVLKAGRIIGYGVAYCDADGKGFRESFYGSAAIPGKNKDRAFIDASTFGILLLIE